MLIFRCGAGNLRLGLLQPLTKAKITNRQLMCTIPGLCSKLLIMMFVLVTFARLGHAQSQRSEELQWASDERLIAVVKLPEKVMTLNELCKTLSNQTGSEFYVDRRYSDEQMTIHAGELRLETAMAIVESVSGLQWRRVGDVFFLTKDARGLAVVKWNEGYEQYRKAELAGNIENSVRSWLGLTMPFPPRTDPVWILTPLQREHMAYRQALLPMTLTPPQIDWLNNALYTSGYKASDVMTPTAQIATELQEIPVKLNIAMVLHSSSGELLVEKPLVPAPKPSPVTGRKPKLTATEQADAETARKTRTIEKLAGLWVTSDALTISDLAETAKQNNLDALFLPVFRAGHSIYPGKRFPQDKKYIGSDPLKQAIDKAHSFGLKLIAIVHATHWGDAEHPAPLEVASYPGIQDMNLLGRRYAEQEQWQDAELGALETRPPLLPTEPLPKNKDIYLCPASSRAADLLKAVLSDLASYEVDGVCLDGIDYPQSTPFEIAGQDLSPPFGYTVEVRREMIRLHQIDPIDIDPSSIRTQADSEAAAAWDKFRRGKLTGLVTELGKSWKKSSPKAMFCVTLNLASDAQSPTLWSKIPEIDALLARLELVKSDITDAYECPKDLTDALSALNRYVGKSAAVIPAVSHVRQNELPDQLTALGRIVKMVEDEGLGGYILVGDSKGLKNALEALGKSAK